MARKRMIDPNIWQSEDFSKLGALAKLVFIGLFSNADDEGRGRAKPAYIKSILFPYDENMRVTDIDRTLTEIASHMSVTFYTHGDSEYYRLDNWHKWQRIDRPGPSTLPVPDEHSTIIRRAVGDDSELIRQPFTPKEKENKDNIIKANEKPEIMNAIQKFPPAVGKAVLEWLEYKEERREGYGPTGLKKLFAQITDKLKSMGADETVRAISDSMACNYRGIIWNRVSKDNSKSITFLGGHEFEAAHALARYRDSQHTGRAEPPQKKD